MTSGEILGIYVPSLMALIVVVGALWAWRERARIAKMTPKERMERMEYEEAKERDQIYRQRAAAQPAVAVQWGTLNTAMVCPHCQTKGKVRTKPIKRKAGISGAKATAAVFTAGVSMLATGLSRKEAVTEARCGNCNSVWHF